MQLAVDPFFTFECVVLHGDVPQRSRERSLAAFRDGSVRVLVATDVAARGLDIPGVTLVVNLRPPAMPFTTRADPEAYVHRSGRTGRAGASGACVTFYALSEEALVRQIEAATGNAFSRLGAPQPEDLAAALGAGPAAALYPPGAPRRSLLSTSEGYVTLVYTPPAAVAGTAAAAIPVVGAAWTALKAALDEDTAASIRGMCPSADGTAAYCDFPAASLRAVAAVIAAGGAAGPLQLARTLPAALGMMTGPAYGGALVPRGGGSGGGGGGRGGGRGGGGGRGHGGGGRGSGHAHAQHRGGGGSSRGAHGGRGARGGGGHRGGHN